jgi:ribonucleoside-triphosphate reductase
LGAKHPNKDRKEQRTRVRVRETCGFPESFKPTGGKFMSKKCMEKTEVYSRVVGYFRPVQQWNKGKQEEFKDRREFVVKEEQTTHECHSRN